MSSAVSVHPFVAGCLLFSGVAFAYPAGNRCASENKQPSQSHRPQEDCPGSAKRFLFASGWVWITKIMVIVFERYSMTVSRKRSVHCILRLRWLRSFGRLFETKKPSDMLREPVINFTMSWNRLLLARRWIAVNVMSGAVTVQNAPGGQQFTNKFTSLQTAISFVE